MSELQRHNDAVDQELMLHSDNSRSHDQLEQEVALARLRARHEAVVGAIVVGLVLLAMVGLCLYTVISRNNDGRAAAARAQQVAEDNGKRIVDLTTELDRARMELVAATSSDLNVVICKDRFTSLQRQTNLNAFATQEELVVAALDFHTDPIARAATIADIRERLTAAVASYRDAIDKSVAWTESGYTLPCPIEPLVP